MSGTPIMEWLEQQGADVSDFETEIVGNAGNTSYFIQLKNQGITTFEVLLSNSYYLQNLNDAPGNFESWLTNTDFTSKEQEYHLNRFYELVNVIKKGYRNHRIQAIRNVVNTLKDNGFDLHTILDFIEPMILVVPVEDGYSNGDITVDRITEANTLLSGVLADLFPEEDVGKCCAEHQWKMLGKSDSKANMVAPPQPATPRTVGIYNVGTLNNSEGGIINCNSPDTSVNQSVTNDEDAE